MRTPFAVAVAGLALLPAAAQAQFPGTDLQRLSRTPDGGVPNGPARNAAISQDKRYGQYAAYESDATDIVSGAGPHTNVYVVRRAEPYGENGTPWSAGSTVVASIGRGGAPANGPSTLPSLSGTSKEAPRCVAFVSAASNLVAGDTNGTPDAFVRDLRSGVTRRVSVTSRGKQSSGTVTEVSVNGLCTRVAFVSTGRDLALRKTRNRSWRSARTRRPPAGTRQVYVRGLGGDTGIEEALEGLTFLASATPGGRAADADSYDVAFATNSAAVTFTSDARNLTAEDTNGVSDVYQRLMESSYTRRFKRRRHRQLTMTNRLVSVGGNGRSHSPSNNVTGEVVAFTTEASSLIGRASPFEQVVQAYLGGIRLASRSVSGAPGNGPAGDPSLTAGGSWVVFTSGASDVANTTNRQADANGAQDAMLFTANTGERWLLGEHRGAAPTFGARTSPHGNYMVFERGGQVHLLYVGDK